MGLVLDSAVLINAEREARPLSELLATLEQEHRETDLLLSSITVIELEHGIYRANTAERARERQDYAIATRNIRHFRMIPGLNVIEL